LPYFAAFGIILGVSIQQLREEGEIAASRPAGKTVDYSGYRDFYSIFQGLLKREIETMIQMQRQLHSGFATLTVVVFDWIGSIRCYMARESRL
jgi:hypothetical protein